MRRLRIITIAIILAAVGAILPMIAVLYCAWLLAFQEESQTLYEYTTRMLTRAKNTHTVVRDMMSLFDHQNLSVSPCSLKHVQFLQKAADSKMDVKAISYFENGKELCTNYGTAGSQKKRFKPNFILPDGLEASVVQSLGSNKTSIITLRKNSNYDFYIDPKRYSDIIVPPEVWLAIVFDGKILSEQNDIEDNLLQEILGIIKKGDLREYYENLDVHGRLKPATALKNDYVFILDNRLISISQYGPFYFIASEPEELVYQNYHKQQLLLLPLGLVTAAFMIGLVFYYSQKRLSFKAELQKAIKNNEFYIHYQPLIQVSSGYCQGAEALIRWQRPNGQIVKPDFFIPHAEITGLISAITEQMIHLVLKEMKAFLIQNKNAHIAINLAADDIHSGHILNVLESKIAKTTINRNQIWLELTERTFLEADKTIKTMMRAQKLGYVVVIDDFGTGFSSLSYLQSMPLNVLKIDKSFLASQGMEAATSHVIDHIIAMAKSLNLQIVAEGVERTTQYEYLKEKKVDYLQGYLFAKPLSYADFVQFFNKNKEKPKQ